MANKLHAHITVRKKQRLAVSQSFVVTKTAARSFSPCQTGIVIEVKCIVLEALFSPVVSFLSMQVFCLHSAALFFLLHLSPAYDLQITGGHTAGAECVQPFCGTKLISW